MMSKTGGEPAVQVNINQLIAQANLLRERLIALDMLINDTRLAILNAEQALKTLDAMAQETILTPGDAGLNTLLFARIVDKERVVVHIGGNIYAVLPREKAEEILVERIMKLNKTLKELTTERTKTENQLAQIETLLQQIALMAQAGRTGGPSKAQ